MRSKFKWIFTLLVAFTMQFSFAQQKTITGVVSDELGPIAGANIVVKGTSTGTTTDFDGNFSISAKQGDVLLVSYLGKKTSEVAVGSSSVVNVSLQEDILTGGNVTVVGALGIKRKADEVTSSYHVVKSEEITQAASPNAVQALVGKVSGLQISQSGNGVNSNSRIVLNGNRSITGNNEALIVIDNAISSSTIFQSLPPEIIESVNTIKGAQGAVLYGEAGSNGVIIVTTKKGAGGEDKMTVNVSSSIDLQEVSYLPVRQTRYGQGWNGYHVAIENGAWGAETNGQMVPVGLPQADGSVIMAPYTSNSNNIKKFFNTGTVLQNGVTISAGSLKSGYATASINRQDREFVVKGDTYKRTNFSFNAGKEVGRLTVQGNVNYFSDVQQSTTGKVFQNLLQSATTIPVERFENSGNEGRWNIYYSNPYWERDNFRRIGESDYFNGGLSLKYDFNKHINIVWNPNVQVFSSGTKTYNNSYVDNAFTHTTVVSKFNDKTRIERNIYSDLLLNFDYMLTDKISFKANLGNNIRDTYSKQNQVGGDNLDVVGSFYNYDNVLNPVGADVFLRNNRTFRFRTASLFANFDIGYNDYLFLNVAGRNDWSSKLSKENNSYFYPGAGISFIPTKAFSGIQGDVLNYAKIYASYTTTGNSTAVNTYAIDPVTSISRGFPIDGLASYGADENPTNPNIRSERNYTKDFGVNLSFFRDRLTIDAQYYYTETKDLITRATASAASGVRTSFLNVGALTNTGYNLDLGFTPIKGRDGSFEWSGKLNFSTYKTVVNKVTDTSDEISFLSSTTAGVFAVKGEEFPMVKGVAYQRDNNGRVKVGNDGIPLKTSGFVNLGKVAPDYILGFTNSFSYKGLRFTVVGDFRKGGNFYSQVKASFAETGNLIESAENGRSGGFIFPNSVVDLDGDNVFEPNTSVVTGGNNYSSFVNYYAETTTVGENFILDATAFKVREVALSYTLPNSLLKGTGIAAASFGINARNLFIWLPKENRFYGDAENNANNSTFAYQGGGYVPTSQYPQTRTYGASLNLTF